MRSPQCLLQNHDAGAKFGRVTYRPVKIWGAASGANLHTLHGHDADVRRGAFNPDGTRLVTAGADRLAIVWAVQTGEQLLTLTAHSASINQARFTPDGQRITTANDDGTTRVWDAANGRELFTLLGQAGAVLDLVISLDGTRIATSGADKLVNFYILDPDDLVKYARSLASRPLTDEESQRYLQTESCTINFEMP